MAHVDTALVQQILDIFQRQWQADTEHHRQSDHFGARLEIAKGTAFCHPARLRFRTFRLTRFTLTGPTGFPSADDHAPIPMRMIAPRIAVISDGAGREKSK